MPDADFTTAMEDGTRDILVQWYYDPTLCRDWVPPVVQDPAPRAVNPSRRPADASGSSGAPVHPVGQPQPRAGRPVDAQDQVGMYDLERARPSKAEAKLREEAGSLQHMLTHLPKNPYCKACMQAKAQPPQQREEANKGQNHWKRDPAIYFGDEVICDHWIEANDVSRGLFGEVVALTLRDRATNWLECRAMAGKSTDDVVKFLVNVIGQNERIRYAWTDSASEYTNAFDKLGIARDNTPVSYTHLTLPTTPYV